MIVAWWRFAWEDRPLLLNMAKVEKELAKHLRDNIRYLASLIPRQHGSSPTGPASLSAWAATSDEAFSIPADNSKIGWALSYSEILASLNWPFPAYIDLKSELQELLNGFHAQQAAAYSCALVPRQPFLPTH